MLPPPSSQKLFFFSFDEPYSDCVKGPHEYSESMGNMWHTKDKSYTEPSNPSRHSLYSLKSLSPVHNKVIVAIIIHLSIQLKYGALWGQNAEYYKEK